MKTLVYFVGNTLALLILSNLLSNFEVSGISSAALFVVILTILNWTVIPVIKFFTFPINWLTLGLFFSLLNVLAVWFVMTKLPGISITDSGFLTSVIISVSLSVVQTIIGKRY